MLGGLLVYLDTFMMWLWLVMMCKKIYPLELTRKAETTLSYKGSLLDLFLSVNDYALFNKKDKLPFLLPECLTFKVTFYRKRHYFPFGNRTTNIANEFKD